MGSSRAQSETLGFVLVFALMVGSIGIVYTAGFSGLQDARDVEQVNNAERAFEVMADNLEDITQRGAPSRATEIRLADATLTVAEPIEVRVNDSSGFDARYPVRPVIYDAGTGERIVYVQGALIRESGDDALSLRESSLLIDENRTVIPIIQTRGPSTREVSGSTTVLIRTSHAVTSLIHEDDDPPFPVWFNVTSPRAGVWIDHLESKSGVDNCLLVGETAACRIETDRIHLTRVQIDVDIE